MDVLITYTRPEEIRRAIELIVSYPIMSRPKVNILGDYCRYTGALILETYQNIIGEGVKIVTWDYISVRFDHIQKLEILDGRHRMSR